MHLLPRNYRRDCLLGALNEVLMLANFVYSGKVRKEERK